MLRATILQGPQGVQTRAEAKARLLELLTGPSIVGELRRMREGAAKDHPSHWRPPLTQMECDVAAKDKQVIGRMRSLEAEGILAMLGDRRCLDIYVTPDPTVPRNEPNPRDPARVARDVAARADVHSRFGGKPG